MGQQEVLKVLERNGNWMTAREIQAKLKGSGLSLVYARLNSMIKFNEIFCKEIKTPRYKALKIYKAK